MANEVNDLAEIYGVSLRINYEKFLKNKLARVRNIMRKHNLEAIICLSDSNISYVTNVPPFPSLGGGASGNHYAILPLEGLPVYFDECDAAYHMEKLINYIEVEYSIPATGGVFNVQPMQAREHLVKMFATQIKDKLKQLKLDKSAIAIDLNVPHIIKALKEEGIEINLDGGEVLREARMIKTAEELKLFSTLGNVIDGCFGIAAESIRPGVTEREVLGKIIDYAINQGVMVNGGYIISGPHTWPKDLTRQFTDRRFRPDDTVVIDLHNFMLAGYTSCCYRTFSVGKASSDVREAYQTAREWLKEAEEILRPGITTKDVVEKWPDEIELWSQRPPFIKSERDKLSTFFNNMGHGLGLQSLYDPPFFWRPLSIRWPQRLEAGMVIALETQEGTKDNRCGVRIEDMIIITDTGYKVITKWPADEITELPLY